MTIELIIEKVASELGIKPTAEQKTIVRNILTQAKMEPKDARQCVEAEAYACRFLMML